MIATLPLKKMTTADKISTMEILWDDICRDEFNYPSPAWHGEVLREREEALKQGKDEFENWEDVKKELRNSLT